MSKGEQKAWNIMRYVLASEGPNRIGGIFLMALSPLAIKIDNHIGTIALYFGALLFALSVIQAITRYLFLDMFGEETHDDEGL